MISALKSDPEKWYLLNKLKWPAKYKKQNYGN
jgi:hypothetical protein